MFLKRRSVYSHVKDSYAHSHLYSRGCDPPHHHLASHFKSQLNSSEKPYLAQSNSPSQTVGHYPARKRVVFTFFPFAKTLLLDRIMFWHFPNLTMASGNLRKRGLPEC